MSLEKLCELFPPPTVPTYVPTEDDWENIRRRFGTDLPNELRQFSLMFGSGTFRGIETTALSIYCPGYKNYSQNMEDECQRLRDIRGDAPNEDHPFNVYPERGGLFPLGGDENDYWLCWVTNGKPDDWPIAVRWTWGKAGIRIFDLRLTDFLVKIFNRTIELPCWQPPTFLDDVRFVPYRPRPIATSPP